MDPESLPLLILVPIGLVGAAFCVWVIRQVRSEGDDVDQRVMQWVKQMGLHTQPRSAGFPDAGSLVASGKLLGQELRVEIGPGRQGTVAVHTSPPGGFPVPMRVAPEGFAATLWKTVSHADINVGDDAFDALVVVAGEDVPGIVGLLDAETRSLMIELVGAQGWTIDQSGMHSDANLLTLSELDELTASISRAAGLTDRLTREGTTERRLIENLFAESKESVRSKNLDMLLTLPQTQAVRDALGQVPSLQSWDMTIRAGEALGEWGIQMLAEAALSAPTPLGLRAVRALGATSGAAAPSAIRAALVRPENEVVLAGVEALGKMRDTGSVDALSDLLLGARDADVRLAAACALGRTGTPAARRSLLKALENTETEVRCAAIAALGECGTVDDILALIDIEYGEQPELRPRARQAIAAIRERTGKVGQGMLSLADSAAAGGALSIASSVAEGALSVEPERRVQPTVREPQTEKE
ncbi:MAG: HEAT repeat domain-containing protein [Acidobacteriota bacterium]